MSQKPHLLIEALKPQFLHHIMSVDLFLEALNHRLIPLIFRMKHLLLVMLGRRLSQGGKGGDHREMNYPVIKGREAGDWEVLELYCLLKRSVFGISMNDD